MGLFSRTPVVQVAASTVAVGDQRALLLRTPVTAIAVMVVGAVVVVTSILNIDLTPFLTRIGTSISTILVLITLFKSEQTHYDINNSLITEKVKAALAETNVPGADQVRTLTPSVPVDMVPPPTALHLDLLSQIADALTVIAATIPPTPHEHTPKGPA